MFSKLFQRYRVAIQKVITADDEAIRAIASALHDLPLVFRAVPFAVETAEKTRKITEEDTLEIISVVALLTALSEDNNFSAEEAISLISRFVEEDNFFSALSKEKLIQIRKRLIDLVDNASTLRVIYKTSKVFNDYERLFDNAEIVTDIRPVFSSGVDTDNTESEVIHAVTATHARKIEYRDTEKTFLRLADQWRRETRSVSSTNELALHPAYQQIIGMGKAAIPLLLRELERKSGQWFWALRAITREDPVPPESKGRTQEMIKLWLEWGREKGYKWSL